MLKITKPYKKYAKTKREAEEELNCLIKEFDEGIPGKDRLFTLREVKRHLISKEKDDTYLGVRPVFFSAIGSIFVYLFAENFLDQSDPNSVTSLLNQAKELSNVLGYLVIFLAGIMTFMMALSVFMVFFYMIDVTMRSRIYKNEIMITLIDEKIDSYM